MQVYAGMVISKIAKFLTPSATEELVHSFVTSRLHNCNFLLFGLPDKLIHHLQLIQPRAAQLITHTKEHDHITPVMRSLHWSPARARINFKTLLLVYKSLHELAPGYFSELIQSYAPESNQRSEMKKNSEQSNGNALWLLVIEPFIRLFPPYETSCPFTLLQVWHWAHLNKTWQLISLNRHMTFKHVYTFF